MKPVLPEFKKGVPITAPEQMLQTIAVLAFHLAVEMDYHYEDEDSPKLQEEVAALEMATATLLLAGLIAPDAVHHSIERFMA
ncbi:hypothetical protein [Roseovarius confluentis]|uniref:hypothetical protein n=1 Tax=Roseovarius confluentis TaxID=1852027 RepID=UPI003BA99768